MVKIINTGDCRAPIFVPLKRKTRRPDRRAPWLVSGGILTHELLRSAAALAPESNEVRLADAHFVAGEQHGKAAAVAKRILASIQRVQ
jgi:hypothetical protein